VAAWCIGVVCGLCIAQLIDHWVDGNLMGVLIAGVVLLALAGFTPQLVALSPLP
jgi:hypothetical protein